MDLGSRVRFYRSLRGLSVRDVAQRSGCSRSFLAEVEGNSVSPSLRSLEKICDALDISISTILRDEPFFAVPIVIPRQWNNCGELFRWETARLLQVFPDSEHAPFAAVLYQIDGLGETPWRQAAESSQKLGVVVKGRINFENKSGLFPLETGEMILINTYAPFRWVNREKEPAEVLSVGMRPFQLYEDVERNARWRQFFKEEVQRAARDRGGQLGARRRETSEVKREKR
ncbi:MAG TPA: helix-turn-helix domain-containing protein [Chthoniobacterales bacterium]